MKTEAIPFRLCVCVCLCMGQTDLCVHVCNTTTTINCFISFVYSRVLMVVKSICKIFFHPACICIAVTHAVLLHKPDIHTTMLCYRYSTYAGLQPHTKLSVFHRLHQPRTLLFYGYRMWFLGGISKWLLLQLCWRQEMSISDKVRTTCRFIP